MSFATWIEAAAGIAHHMREARECGAASSYHCLLDSLRDLVHAAPSQVQRVMCRIVRQELGD